MAYADRVLLNKTDLVPASTVARVGAIVAAINPSAPRIECERADVPLGRLLGLHSFDDSVEAIARCHPTLARREEPERPVVPAPPTDGPAAAVRAVCLRVDGDVDEEGFDGWLAALLQARGEDLLRMKGVLAVAGRAERRLFHTVHMTFEGAAGRAWGAAEVRSSRVVVIGRRLSTEDLRAGFRGCAAGSVCRSVEPEASVLGVRAG